MMWSSLLLAAGMAAHASANCAYGTSAFPRTELSVAVSTFGYDALKGPLNWYGLNETANSACDKGEIQSPIVLTSNLSTVAGSSVTWTVPDYPSGAEFENLGTNVEVVVNGSLVASGVTYELAQFHFHTPAEHRINDEFYPMEMHWVFESAAKEYAVIAFLVELCPGWGCSDPVLTSIFQSVTEIATPGEAVYTGPLAFGELIAKFGSSTAWTYSGSLTTPPCSEGVLWLISQELLYLDLATWLTVKSVVKFNARYTQDNLGGVNLLQNAADELA